MKRRPLVGRRALGYSLIEVMTAVAVMTVGASGILLMQGAATHSNQDAYETTIALNFASTWIERVKRDALLWTAANVGTGGTLYLNRRDEWWAPALPLAAPEESIAADYHGFDTVNRADMRYCMNMRTSALQNLGGADSLLRVDIMVWWHRSARGDQDVVDRRLGDCEAALPQAEWGDPRYRMVFLSTVVHWVAPI